MEPHLPYSPPDRFLAAPLSSGWDRAELRRLDQDRLRDLQPGRERTPREIDGLTLLYKAEVAYADYLVGRLVDRLRESGRLDATLTVVTSDHGENLGQHPPLDHQLGLYDTLLRIPLILRYPPGVRPQGRSDDLVSLQDLPGVILRLAGVQRRAGPLFGEPPRDAVFFEYDRPSHILDLIRSRLQLDPAPWDRTLAGIRSRDAKWIRASNGRHEAYDLMMDPGERSNLATAGGVVPASVTALADRLDSVLTARAAGTSPGQPPLSEEARQRLRSLGYLR